MYVHVYDSSFCNVKTKKNESVTLLFYMTQKYIVPKENKNHVKIQFSENITYRLRLYLMITYWYLLIKKLIFLMLKHKKPESVIVLSYMTQKYIVH